MKGIKTGGRRKGTPNKTKVAERKAIAKSGLMPRDYMLKLMRDSKLPLETRLRAAQAAAPYCHARYQTVELTGQGGNPIHSESEVKIVVEFV